MGYYYEFTEMKRIIRAYYRKYIPENQLTVRINKFLKRHKLQKLTSEETASEQTYSKRTDQISNQSPGTDGFIDEFY